MRLFWRLILVVQDSFRSWLRKWAGTDDVPDLKWKIQDAIVDVEKLRRELARLRETPPQMTTIPPQDAVLEGLKARIDALAKRNPEELALAASTQAMIAVEAAHRLRHGAGKKALKAFDAELYQKVLASVEHHLPAAMLNYGLVPIADLRVAVEACIDQVVAHRLTTLIGAGSITIGAPVNAKADKVQA